MVKTYTNEVEKMTIAVVTGDGMDAVRYVDKRMIKDCPIESLMLDKLVMPAKNVGVVKCHGGDAFDLEEGKRLAVEKADKNYFRSFKLAMTRWQVAMLKKIYTIYPDTYKDAVSKVNDWVDKQSGK